MGDQYTQTINTLQTQIASLESQLEVQGKNVETIKGSNIVTGKGPVPVEITNPSGAGGGEPQLKIFASEMPAQPNATYGKNARQFIFTTNRRMNGGRMSISCKNKINGGYATLAGAGGVMGGGSNNDDHTFSSGIAAPDWSPQYPLVIILFYDESDLGGCTYSYPQP